ncbi:MAG TPA: DUF5985 family protein [Silvibacterium sp.]|nr:DUF5985 family protein [Silvibacterium sp.]
MTQMLHPFTDIFLLGFIAGCSLVAALFFLRFWRETRDLLFLSFVVFFVIQGFSNMFVISLRHPNLGSPLLFALRLFSVLVVLGAILRKNLSQN